MSDKIKNFDVVRLKSESPNMVVETIESGSTGEIAHCAWVAENKRHSAKFFLETLELVTPPTAR